MSDRDTNAFLQKHVNHFHNLQVGVRRGLLQLIECTDKKTGEKVAAIAVITQNNDGTHTMYLIARMFEGDPREQVQLPGTAEGVIEVAGDTPRGVN